MNNEPDSTFSGIERLLQQGEHSIKQGRTVPYTPGLMDRISEEGKRKALGKPEPKKSK